MPRPNPLKMKLPPDWREAMLKILEMAACPSGSANRSTVVDILSHKKAEEAVKYLLDASGGWTPSHNEIVNLAFTACAGARTMVRLHRRDSSKAATTRKTIKRLAEDAMAIAEQNPSHTFSIHVYASSLFRESPFPRLDNATILNALMIAEGLVDALAWQPKRHATGRNLDAHRKTLVIYLTGLFRRHFGKSVSGAVGALVSATFSNRPALTGKAVQEMLSRK